MNKRSLILFPSMIFTLILLVLFIDLILHSFISLFHSSSLSFSPSHFLSHSPYQNRPLYHWILLKNLLRDHNLLLFIMFLLFSLLITTRYNILIILFNLIVFIIIHILIHIRSIFHSNLLKRSLILIIIGPFIIGIFICIKAYMRY